MLMSVVVQPSIYIMMTHELPLGKGGGGKWGYLVGLNAVCSLSHCLMSRFNELRCNYNWPNFTYPHPPRFTDTSASDFLVITKHVFGSVECYTVCLA